MAASLFTSPMLTRCLSACRQDSHYTKYSQIFEEMNLSDTDLYKLYIVNNAKTSIINQNRIKISCKEDDWILEKTNKKGCVKLYHNNYKKTFDGTRWFIDGYHDQFPNIKNLSSRKAIDSIVTYVWNGHPQDIAYLMRQIRKKNIAI